MAASKKIVANPEITIVIGTLNRPGVVSNLLAELARISKNINLEVLLFDQSDTKNYQTLPNSFPALSNFFLIHLEKPNTCAYLNLGWKKAHAPIVLYLDDDVSVTSETIMVHIQSYSDPKILAVAGRVIDDNTSKSADDFVGKIQYKGAVFQHNFSSVKKQFVQFPYGCNMSFRKTTLAEFDGFDENLHGPVYSFNEIDLGYRIDKKYKNSILFAPSALVYHKKYPSGGTRSFDKNVARKENSFNYGYFLAKNFTIVENSLFFIRRAAYQFIREPGAILDILRGFYFGKLKKKFSLQSTLTIPNLLFLFIVTYSLFSRFYKIGQFFTFNFDEEYQVLLSWEQVKNFHPIWIGVSASTVNYYLGPGMVYLGALLLHITRDPIILAFFGSMLGVIVVLSLYYIVADLFSKKAALYSSVFYTGSLFLNYFDRRFWNVTPTVFISLWLFYSLMKAKGSSANNLTQNLRIRPFVARSQMQKGLYYLGERPKENTRWLIITAILMAATLHIHLSLLSFWPIIIGTVFLLRKKIIPSTWIAMIVGFFAVYSPLLIFDLNHNFDNIKMPLRLIQSFINSTHDSHFFYGLNQFFNTLSRIWYMRPYTNVQDEIQLGVHGIITPTNQILTIFSLVIVVWTIFLSLKIERYRILVSSMISFLIVYLLYPSGVVAYFLLGFIALFSIAVGLFFAKLPKKIGIVVMIAFISINLYALLTTQQEQFGLATRKHLIQKIMPTIGTKTFYLETRTTDGRKYHSAGGWRYLFKVYGKTPAQSHTDDFFGWIYPDEISVDMPQLRVIISEYPSTVAQPTIAVFKEGVYYGYVVNNL